MAHDSEDFPKLSEKEAFRLINKRPLEEVDKIRTIEAYFRKKRGYVFSMPKPKTPVILLLSGGLDTVTMWEILLKKYKLKVYPLFFRRGQIRTVMEEKAVDYFYRYYSKRYPKLCMPPKKINAFMPPHEIRWPITKIGTNLISKNPPQARGLPVYTSLLFDYAVQYAYFLETTKDIKMRTVFCGVMPSDSNLFSYETLTGIRLINYDVCTLTRDYEWQFTSLAIEKELGFFFDKEVLIKWAAKNKIPLEHTYSCIELNSIHCGFCGFCRTRKNYFAKAGIRDPAKYLSDSPKNIILFAYYKLETIFLVIIYLLKLQGYLFFVGLRYVTYIFNPRQVIKVLKKHNP